MSIKILRLIRTMVLLALFCGGCSEKGLDISSESERVIDVNELENQSILEAPIVKCKIMLISHGRVEADLKEKNAEAAYVRFKKIISDLEPSIDVKSPGKKYHIAKEAFASFSTENRTVAYSLYLHEKTIVVSEHGFAYLMTDEQSQSIVDWMLNFKEIED